jgi:hypothetical protein
MIGPNHDGLSESTHYRFIDNYRHSALLKETYPEYVRQFIYTEERSKEIEHLTEIEEMSIQLEMLIYLKIWESDAFIRRLYQVARLVHKENYDWHFVIKELKNGQEKNLTGTRDEIIRVKFRDRMQSDFPAIYQLTKRAFITQIRNAIAHSQYSMFGGHIQLNNYNRDDEYSKMKALSFKDWTEMFHDTIELYNEMIGFKNRIDAFYAEQVKQTNDEIEIRMSDHENKNERFSILKYDRVWKRYYWKSNEESI